MKKKILAIALVVVLIAIMVGGSLAYFTDSDKVTNTFTVGSVRIEIYENDEATDSDTIAFTDPLVPVVNEVPSADESYIAKVVKVRNTGANAAYIRTHIAIPTALVGYLELDMDKTGWNSLNTTYATVDGVAYTVYSFNYATAVDPDAFTGELLKGVYLASDVDLTEDANGNLLFKDSEGTSTFVAHTKTANGYTSATINVLVASQAIQTEGFSDAAAALNAGFGIDTNPWQ